MSVRLPATSAREAPENLAILLREPFRVLSEQLIERLAERGHPEVRYAHGTVFQFLDDAGTRVVDLAQRAGMTKQSMAQLVQQGLLTALVSILSCLGVAVALIALEPSLALAVAVVLPPLFVSSIWFRRLSGRDPRGARRRQRDSVAALQCSAVETAHPRQKMRRTAAENRRGVDAARDGKIRPCPAQDASEPEYRPLRDRRPVGRPAGYQPMRPHQRAHPRLAGPRRPDDQGARDVRLSGTDRRGRAAPARWPLGGHRRGGGLARRAANRPQFFAGRIRRVGHCTSRPRRPR